MANTNNPQPLTLLVLVNSLYEWSQNFITRELTEPHGQGTDMYIGMRKVVKRDDLSDKEKALEPQVVSMPENPFTP